MTWLQTGSGRAVDLLNPKPEDIDFRVDVPEALARVARFTGHVRSGPYSVAQHCALGADAILRQTHRPEAALAFLLHDAKEAYVGDMSQPFKQALARTANDPCGNGHFKINIIENGNDLGPVHGAAFIHHILRRIETGFDRAIHAAAGLSWPLPPDLQAIVKGYDIRMLATERRFLLGPSPRLWAEEIERAELIRVRGKFTVWPWPQAADEFRARLADLCPRLLN